MNWGRFSEPREITRCSAEANVQEADTIQAHWRTREAMAISQHPAGVAPARQD